jgi:RluA family pseudouridine synthase
MPGCVKLSSPETHQFWEIPVLHHDEHLLALDKPAGLPISPDPADPERPSLVPLLHAAIAAGKPWAREYALSFLASAHRLDTETSGVLLFARDKSTLSTLANWFGAARPGRQYVALVEGNPPHDIFEVDARLAPHPARPGLVHVNSNTGKTSRTQFEVLERFRDYCLVKCDALMDRRHQVRVHLRHAHFPVLGDRAYGGPLLMLSRLKPGYRPKHNQPENPLLAAPALYADRLSLPHPVTGNPLTITASQPKELSVALKYLRLFNSVPVGQSPADSATQEPPATPPASS